MDSTSKSPSSIGSRFVVFWGVILVIGLAALTVAGWHTQAKLVQRLDRCAEELERVRETQQSLLKRKQGQWNLQVRGHAFLDEPSRPAAGAQIELRTLPDLKVFRILRTDEEGDFNSGPLTPGDYFVFAPLVGDGNPIVEYYVGDRKETGAIYCVQSQPLYVYPDLTIPAVEMDIKFHPARISFNLDQRIPGKLEQGERRLVTTIKVAVKPRFRLPLDLDDWAWPDRWPVYGTRCSSLHSVGYVHTGLDAEDAYSAVVGAGEYDFLAAIRLESERRDGGVSSYRPFNPPREAFQVLQINPGEHVHVVGRFSGNMESKWRELLNIDDFGPLEGVVDKQFQPKAAKIEVVSTTPIERAE